MPISEILLKKIGREIREWIFLGIKTGIRRAVADYRVHLSTNPDHAILCLKRAVDLPRRARIRIETAVAKFGITKLQAALATDGTVTITELNIAISTLETYATSLYNHYKNDAWTFEQIATDIESNIELESNQWDFPLPSGYRDIWGE